MLVGLPRISSTPQAAVASLQKTGQPQSLPISAGAAGERSDATGGKFEETCRHRIGVRLMDGAADGPGKIEEREIAAAPADL